MSDKLSALLRYHEAAQKLDQLDARIKSTPERQRYSQLYAFLSEQQAQIRATQKQIESRQTTLEKVSVQFDELQHQYELELGEFEIMQGDEECTAEEMTESRHNMEKLMERVTSARRTLFDTLAWIEKAVGEYKTTNAKASKAKKEFDAIRAICEQQAAASRGEVDALHKEVDALRATVDAELIKRYDAIKTHHAVPVARVANDQCGGCNMSLPTAVVKRVATGDAIVECENCGRILYI